MTRRLTEMNSRYPLSLWLTLLALAPLLTQAFMSTPRHSSAFVEQLSSQPRSSWDRIQSSPSRTALNVWWFGGTEERDIEDGDSCELVAVRIEKTSANSRGIAGEITAPCSLEDVWAILTDYNRLAIHVPNLVESKILSTRSRQGSEQGDGKFECRLYQKGAQKIIGFEFGADVTMDMTERIVSSDSPQVRKISFKCTDSFFFSEFDGDWVVSEMRSPDGTPLTKLSYSVDVRPKGPVPVAALEWRIREDVPTNLRAVKRAALGRSLAKRRSPFGTTAALTPSQIKHHWQEDETMATYLKNEAAME